MTDGPGEPDAPAAGLIAGEAVESSPARAGEELRASAEDRRLAELARAAVAARLRGEALPASPGAGPGGDDSMAAGAFVELRVDGALRGHLGRCDRGGRALDAEVVSLAAAAASEDPRFPPLTVEELSRLQVKVTVLGPRRRGRVEQAARPGGARQSRATGAGGARVEGLTAGRPPPGGPREMPEEASALPLPGSLRPGRDGLLVRLGWHGGLLLPAVAHREWSAEEVLARACLSAGLPPGAWREPAATVELFEVEEAVSSPSAAR